MAWAKDHIVKEEVERLGHVFDSSELFDRGRRFEVVVELPNGKLKVNAAKNPRGESWITATDEEVRVGAIQAIGMMRLGRRRSRTTRITPSSAA